MSYQLIWLADCLRKAGLKVQEQTGWNARGRGDMGKPLGVMVHHTAGAMSGNAPSLDLIVNGRPDLAGPLSHLVLGRNGTWFVVAAGRCNHAGAGYWQGVTEGNTHFIGIEAENAGTGKDPWPGVQIDSLERGVAAILSYIDADDVMAVGHKEYALPKGRKIDPSFDMVQFRDNVRILMDVADLTRTVYPLSVDPHREMLRKGCHGESVVQLQGLLGITPEDGNFGPATEKAVRAFQAEHNLLVDGKVGPSTWKLLLA